jgi:trk system potassium uptake protein TrkA
MRFGVGSLAVASTVLQDGDQVFMLVTDDTVGPVLEIASGTGQKGH